MFEEIDLSDVIENAVVERDNPVFCTVYLLGAKTTDNPVGAPKVIGLEQGFKSDHALKEEAYLVYMERIRVDGAVIVRKS